MLVVATGPASHGRVPTSTAASAGPVSNALIRATRLHMILARYLLQRVGLHPGQELLLMRLWDAGPQRQADLASEFGTDSASMTRTVQRLERAGFVRRRPDPSDGRATLVESTEAGTALRGRIEELWAELEAQTVGDLSQAQLGQLLLGLQHLEENLSLATDSARWRVADVERKGPSQAPEGPPASRPAGRGRSVRPASSSLTCILPLEPGFPVGAGSSPWHLLPCGSADSC